MMRRILPSSFPPHRLRPVFLGGAGSGVTEFQTDSGACMKEATIKYDVASERIYRACMKSRNWRGPGPADSRACAGPTASRPQHCPRR
jgi:hypothetical protein